MTEKIIQIMLGAMAISLILANARDIAAFISEIGRIIAENIKKI